VTAAAYQATAEVLRLISEWHRDPQPVFDAIVQMSTRLCEANYGFLMRYDGAMLSVAAQSAVTNAEMESALRAYPRPATRETITGRTVLDGRVVQIRDIQKEPTYGLRVIQQAGWRTGAQALVCRCFSRVFPSARSSCGAGESSVRSAMRTRKARGPGSASRSAASSSSSTAGGSR
jgi:hypothetical protein